jgi:hypothetical protein
VKLFWSWQSDTPGKIGRFLVRDALQQAIEELKEAPNIEEPTAQLNREALHLDHDVKGVTGSPDLVRTIFDKIDISEVVIADVTLVGQTPGVTDGDGKPSSLDAFLLAFFALIYDATGYARPDNLHGFPPGRPT